ILRRPCARNRAMNIYLDQTAPCTTLHHPPRKGGHPSVCHFLQNLSFTAIKCLSTHESRLTFHVSRLTVNDPPLAFTGFFALDLPQNAIARLRTGSSKRGTH